MKILKGSELGNADKRILVEAEKPYKRVSKTIKYKTMSDFKFSGRMSIGRLQKQFKNEFGGTLRVYHGNKFADPDDTIASIRKGGTSKSGEFDVSGNMHVGRFEREMKEQFGIKVQVANADNTKLASDKSPLSKCAN